MKGLLGSRISGQLAKLKPVSWAFADQRVVNGANFVTGLIPARGLRPQTAPAASPMMTSQAGISPLRLFINLLSLLSFICLISLKTGKLND